MLDLSIHYPYNLPFLYSDKLIKFKIINNEDHIIEIYYIINEKVIKSLIQMILPREERNLLFPDNSFIAIIPIHKKKPKAYIKIKNGWTYIYP